MSVTGTASVKKLGASGLRIIGSFTTLEDLQNAYPTPQDGLFSVVNIDGTPGGENLYVSDGGQWNELSGGTAGTGHTIQDEGTPLTQRANLNFVGANVTVTDDSGNNATVVTISGGSGSGDVVGPASSTDNAITRFDSTTGKLIQNSTVTLDDSGNLNNVNGIQLDTTPVADSFSTGKIRWNNQDGTAEIDTDVNGVTVQLGQETVIRSLNKTGSTIANGSVVYVNGAQGNRPTIAKVGNTDLTNGEKVIGVVTADILDNAEGYVTTQGLVRDLNTNSYSVGDTLWIGSTAGTFTNVEPAASSLIIKIGEVIVAHPTQGIISVNVENPLTSTVLKNMGAITTEWTGFFDNSNIDVSGDSSTRVVTLTRPGGIGYYHSGKRFSQTSPYALPAHGNVTSNIYYCSFDSTGTFSWSTSPFNFATQGQVAVARYDSVLGTWVYTRETHGLVMDWSTHEDLHNTVGTWHKSGGALTAGTYATQPASPADADNTPGVDSAIIVDEDLSTTVNAWTQGTYTTLRFVSSVATFDTGATLPFRVTGTYPNINTGGASETETVTGRFFNVYVVLTPAASDVQSQKYRVLWVQPQTAYTTTAAAQAEQFSSLNLGNLGSAFQEYAPVRRITYATNASYTGATGRCRIDAVTIPGTTRAASSVSSLDPSKLPLDGGSMNGSINESKGADISSATTTDIGAATGNFVDVTGTTTITGLGTVQAGTRRIVRFTGALTLTHNATSLILPTGANITTAAGDTATFVSLGSGNWVCTSYQRKDGTALVSSGGGSGGNEFERVYIDGVGIVGEIRTQTARKTVTPNGVYLRVGQLPIGTQEYTTTGNSWLQLGNAASNTKVAEVFTAGSTFAGTTVSIRLKKTGNPVDNVEIKFLNTSANLPSTFLNSVDRLLSGTRVDTTGSDFSFTIPSTSFTSAGVYAIEISRTGAVDAANYYAVEVTTSGGTTGDQACIYNGSSWSSLGTSKIRYSINGGDLFDIWKRSDDTAMTSTDSITGSSCFTISSLSDAKRKFFGTSFFSVSIASLDTLKYVLRNTGTVPSVNAEISITNS